jgi:hypothetical protein
MQSGSRTCSRAVHVEGMVTAMLCQVRGLRRQRQRRRNGVNDGMGLLCVNSLIPKSSWNSMLPERQSKKIRKKSRKFFDIQFSFSSPLVTLHRPPIRLRPTPFVANLNAFDTRFPDCHIDLPSQASRIKSILPRAQPSETLHQITQTLRRPILPPSPERALQTCLFR